MGGWVVSGRLIFSAVSKLVAGIVLVGGLLFLPAGTFAFANGWLLMGILFVPILIMGVILLVKNPTLLQKRLEAKEEAKDQSAVVKLSGLMFCVGFILAGLGYRFGWYRLPPMLSVIGAVIFLLSYVLYAEVLRENTYLSRTIRVQDGQQVIDTGLYRIVRHPMYSATLFLFWSVPLILGSAYALAVFLVYPLLIAKRIEGEEALLEKELQGYAEYKEKVKYRLIPFVW